MRLCVSCSSRVDDAGELFCSRGCRQAAKAIRYGRSAVADGRIKDPDVRAALETKIGFAAAGGYPDGARRLSSAVRTAAFARDKGLCQLCRAAPATEIDHVQGSSAEMANLRAVCDP